MKIVMAIILSVFIAHHAHAQVSIKNDVPIKKNRTLYHKGDRVRDTIVNLLPADTLTVENDITGFRTRLIIDSAVWDTVYRSPCCKLRRWLKKCAPPQADTTTKPNRLSDLGLIPEAGLFQQRYTLYDTTRKEIVFDSTYNIYAHSGWGGSKKSFTNSFLPPPYKSTSDTALSLMIDSIKYALKYADLPALESKWDSIISERVQARRRTVSFPQMGSIDSAYLNYEYAFILTAKHPIGLVILDDSLYKKCPPQSVNDAVFRRFSLELIDLMLDKLTDTAYSNLRVTDSTGISQRKPLLSKQTIRTFVVLDSLWLTTTGDTRRMVNLISDAGYMLEQFASSGENTNDSLSTFRMEVQRKYNDQLVMLFRLRSWRQTTPAKKEEPLIVEQRK